MAKCDICENETVTKEWCDGWTCETCGQEYPFDEGIIMSITDEQLLVLRQHYKRKPNTPTKEVDYV